MANLAKLQEEMEGYCGLGMYDEALRIISSLKTRGDEDLTLAFLRTRILRAAGRFAEMRKTAEKIRARCPEVANAYGMTETVGSVTFTFDSNDIEVLDDSVGWPVPEYGVRVAGPAGEPAGGHERDQADRRLRPRARRAAITFWPPFVAMRARNPWRRLRTSLLG